MLGGKENFRTRKVTMIGLRPKLYGFLQEIFQVPRKYSGFEQSFGCADFPNNCGWFQ